MLFNETKQELIAKQVEMASTFWQKFKGLMFRGELPQESCLVIHKCNSIHTCFMKFPLDVIFLNKQHVVLHLIRDFKPFRFSPIIKDATTVVELASGQIASSHTEVGDTLSFYT